MRQASAAHGQLVQDPLQVGQHRQLIQQHLVHVAPNAQQSLDAVAALLQRLCAAARVHQQVVERQPHLHSGRQARFKGVPEICP